MIDIIQTVLILVVLWFLYAQRTTKAPSRSSIHKMVLDTCALIDGRILELSKLGFVPESLIIPEFVIHELQMLADGPDAHKRDRARFGLDVVRELQDSKYCEVVIDKTAITDKHAVDDKLVELAKRLDAPLYTTDYNLNKVADIEGVRVLNVNELAQNLRAIAIPGERKDVKIMQKGSNAQQGVGYLDDGTMIVVDGAAKYMGKKVLVEITRIHQTAAGKMLFAEVVEKELPVAVKTAMARRPVQLPKPMQKAAALRHRLRTR